MSRQPKTRVRLIDALLRAERPTGPGVEELFDDYVKEQTEGLVFGDRCGGVIGISAERESVSWAVCGPLGIVKGGQLQSGVAPIDGDPADPGAVRDLFKGAFEAAKEHVHVPDKVPLAGVGVAWPCAIGIDGEPTRYENHHPDWGDDASDRVKLRPIVLEALLHAGLTVVRRLGNGSAAVEIVNDADADLIYEARHGVAKGTTNAIGVKICGGLGVAIMCDGRLLEGHTGRTGEIQHIPVRFEAAKGAGRDTVKDLSALDRCWCGGETCIARFATGRSIIDQLPAYATKPSYTDRARSIEAHRDREDIQEVFQRAGELLGEALIGPVLAFDPQHVVITAFPWNRYLLDSFRSKLKTGTRVPAELDDICLAEPLSARTAAGAARVVIEQEVLPRIEHLVSPNNTKRYAVPIGVRAAVPSNVATLQEWTPRYRGGARSG